MEGLGTTANVYNMLTDPETWKGSMITCSHIDYFLASRGVALFEDTGPLPEVVDKVGLLGNHFIGVAGLYTLDPNIKTEKDLVGKRIALGKIGQVAWALIQTTVLKEIAEIDCQIDYLLPNTATQALIDGKADAAGILMVMSPDATVMRPPGAYTIMEASGKTPYWISWSDDTIKKAEATGWSPYLNPRLIAPGSFIGVQPDPLYLSYIVNGWAMHKDYPEEVVYEFTKWYIEYSAKLGEIDKVADTFAKPEWLVSGIKKEWLHPGALRAYQEAGIPIGE